MTDNDWIKQLRSTMEEHKETAPDGLWPDINRRLPQRRKVMPSWLRYAAAAAVAGVIIGVGSLLWNPFDSIDTAVPERPAIAQAEEISPEAVRVESMPQSDKRSIQSTPSSPVAHRPMAPIQRPSVPLPQEEEQPAPEPETNVDEAPAQTVSSDTTTARPRAVTTQQEPYFANTPPTRPVAPTRQKQPVSVGLYASNQFLDLLGNSGADMASNPHDHNSPVDSTQLDNGSNHDRRSAPRRESQEHAKHHAPYSLGVSVSIPLGGRLALTSGLVYTRLKSDFSTREQSLHYIGVPIGVTYSLWKWRFVNLYAIGGVQADFNFKATIKKSTEAMSRDTAKDRVQFSTMLGPGLQLNLNKDFGFYVEPTVRYYYNNGSAVLNYFKDQPWNINFNAGLRLTLH